MATRAGDPQLEGRWVYTIQGLMQWTNPDNLRYDPKGDLETGVAFADDPTSGEPRTLKDLVSIPISLVPIEPIDPVPHVEIEGFGTRKAWQPLYPGQRPDLIGSVPPHMGYLPFCESGCIDFASGGTLTASIWFTIAGRSIFFPTPKSITVGRFRFNPIVLPETDPNAASQPIGVMSFAFDLSTNAATTHLNWDYSFVMVSNDEAQLITLGRLPRPATGSGIMKRAQWDKIRRIP